MANQEHLNLLRLGVTYWNTWREMYPNFSPDLSKADFSGMKLSDKFDSNTKLSEKIETKLIETLDNSILTLSDIEDGFAVLGDFQGRTYSNPLGDYSKGINLSFANLSFATLRGANLSGANLYHANLSFADLSKANLEKADLGRTNLIEATLEEANLAECFVYGVSAWDVKLRNTVQSDLIITRPWQPTITVDNLEIAQLIYLLLNTLKIRDVIDTITSKIVLVLGRFTPERKKVLDAIKDELRRHNYLPILFDFENPKNRDVTETVRTLAHLARFIIADLTDPSSIPLELETIVPLLEVPVQPLVLETKREFSMFDGLKKYQWVLPIPTNCATRL